MDCLRSFNFGIGANENTAAGEFYGWAVGAQHFWVCTFTNVDSVFNITGFKNINIHKISINGTVGSGPFPATSGLIVNNWSWNVEVVGQNSVTGGNVSVTPNGFNAFIQPINPTFVLSKHTPSIEFATPVQSARQILITGFYTDGIGNQSLTNGQMAWNFYCTVYYTFEGE